MSGDISWNGNTIWPRISPLKPPICSSKVKLFLDNWICRRVTISGHEINLTALYGIITFLWGRMRIKCLNHHKSGGIHKTIKYLYRIFEIFDPASPHVRKFLPLTVKINTCIRIGQITHGTPSSVDIISRPTIPITKFTPFSRGFSWQPRSVQVLQRPYNLLWDIWTLHS